MSSPISAITSITLPSAVQGPAEASRPGAFQAALESAINKVENLRDTAAQNIERFLAGEGGELHSTILAVQRAELAFEMFLQVRNKVVQAYQEIMRMQI
ncbi:MAG TPA: flagellar hook-basal body complex protein FliE [Bryobacteraceae bacterium]|mgnify:CR=1 FL=1|nr:flagellar hook-basal body complex protein FliE [Bryobacteraceae bacterium]HOQ45782.1 flagellar hook-basal body complex protein FliE [Bryobacteraceae bacterium]HPQ15927.1 flagellar hook-basal body complex protein FliE [Bryobacteraceae bacterium]HPU71491.1 flagellar hook-basal body complex protein FliE [Bryobacteraceae bacterium]